MLNYFCDRTERISNEMKMWQNRVLNTFCAGNQRNLKVERQKSCFGQNGNKQKQSHVHQAYNGTGRATFQKKGRGRHLGKTAIIEMTFNTHKSRVMEIEY